MPSSVLHLPLPNELIATDFALRYETAATRPALAIPKLLVNDELSRLWHKPDVTFGMPKLNVMVCLTTPLSYSNPDQCVPPPDLPPLLSAHPCADTVSPSCTPPSSPSS